MAGQDKEKPKSVLEGFLDRVHGYLPSRTFSERISGNDARHPSSFRYRNRVGVIAGAGFARILGRYCDVVQIVPDAAPEPALMRDLDVVIVTGEILERGEPWRAALLDLEGQGSLIRRLARLAGHQRVPVVYWHREELDAVDLFAHLFDAMDLTVMPPGAPETGRRGIELGAHADVKTFNPISVDLGAAEKRAPFLRYLVDGYHDIGIGYPEGAFLDWMEPLLDENWWGTDSSYHLRNNDRKIPAAMRRRFLGSLRGPDIANALRIARAYILPAPKVAARPLHAAQLALDAAACKTTVITDHPEPPASCVVSAPTAEGFAQLVAWMRDDEVGQNARRQRAWRHAVGERSLFEALDAIFAAVGVIPRPTEAADPHVNIVVPTIRPELIPFVLSNANRQVHGNLSVTIVVNGKEVAPALRRMVDEDPRASLLYMPADKTIGYCINLAIDHVGADYWAKFDDDDIYGAHYLSDMLLQRKYADFDITGKAAIFTYFEELDRLHIRRLSTRDSYLHYVGGGTILARGRSLGFPENVRGYADTLFLTDAAEKGNRILAADPFNFVQVRRADPTSHTWTAGREELNLLGPSREGIDLGEALA